MAKVKVLLVQILNPKNWAGKHVIVPSGILEFISSDGVTHTVKNLKGEQSSLVGKIYQMVGYNPDMAEENQFLPIAETQWRLCTKYIPRDPLNNLVIGLSDNGIIHNHAWQIAACYGEYYELFKRVTV